MVGHSLNKHTRRSEPLSDLDKGSSELGDEAVASGDVRVLLVSLCELADDPPGLTEVKVCGRRTKGMPWLLCDQPKDWGGLAWSRRYLV